MEQSSSIKVLSARSAILALVSTFFTVTVPAGAWNYSAEGGALSAGFFAGIAAVAVAWPARKGGRNLVAEISFWLGIGMAVIGPVMLVVGGYDLEFG